MNICKQQSINSFMTEILVVQKTSTLTCLTGFRIIGTSVKKDSRRSSTTYTKSLLHVVKYNFFSVQFFFQEYSRFTGQHMKGRPSPYIISTTSTRIKVTQTVAGLLLQRNHLCAQLAPGIKHRIFSTCSLESTLSILALVAAVVRRMLMARVTLIKSN